MEERLHAVEIDHARYGERLEHIHDCLELLKEHTEKLTNMINSLEKTVLVKFSEMRGRELQARRIAVMVSAVVSMIVTAAGVAVAALF